MSGWFELLSQSKARVVLSTSAWCSLVFGWVGLAIAESAENSPRVVSVASAPDRPWSKKETRTLEDLPKIPFDPEGSRFGGVPGKFGKGTGFFRVINPEGRWWLVDPDGHLFLHRGVTSVRQTKTDDARKKLKETFGSPMDWGKSTGVFLKESGFNGLGPWSDETELQPTKAGLVYTKLWNFMSTYGRKRGGVHQRSGHTGYSGDCPFIFDPEFAVHCDELARELVATKDDPWLLGHFTDNELPWNIEMLDRYLALPKDEAGYLAASKWLKERRGGEAKSSKISNGSPKGFICWWHFQHSCFRVTESRRSRSVRW